MSEAVTAPSLLIIDDDAEIRYSLHRVLTSRGYRVLTASGGQEGIAIAKQERPHVIFLDNRMEGMTGLETLQHLRTASAKSMVILMTAYGTTQTAIEAMKFGAFDYIIKPFDVKKVLSLTVSGVKACDDLLASDGGYTPLLNSEEYKEGIVGSSEPMQDVFKKIGQVAASEVTVMITGESGTGKELVARCIWQHSLRSGQPFMAVNCAAIPDNLIESELFGHEKGAFTGATNQRLGKFELCDGGTLFLDEIGDMALATQTKILRAIQEGEIQRVGGTKTIQVDVRLIAATNKDLEKMVVDKTFREDLYYRLNVMRIKLPSLRERVGDVPQLIDFMLQRLNKERKTKVRQVSTEALALLNRYPWPGNVRELENVIQRSVIVAQGETILPKDLPVEVRDYFGVDVPLPVQSVQLTDVAMGHPHSEPESTLIGVAKSQPVEAAARTQAPKPSAAEPATRRHTVPPVVAKSTEPNEPARTAASGDLSMEDTYTMLYNRLRKDGSEGILELIERGMIQLALKETGGNQVRTSLILGITRATLRKRIDEWRLHY
ncbi:MAG: sigma-54 dependent transcriptional regulator [Verrucomicrobiota bacterium]|nr:sigma-54 dependent transcriptional regulator [Verrucomicrobiota bacterium]